MDDSLAERIQYLLDRKGVTPYIASKKSGVSEATFSRLLSQKNAKPNSYTLNRLSEYFNISEQWILTGKTKVKKTWKPILPVSRNKYQL